MTGIAKGGIPLNNTNRGLPITYLHTYLTRDQTSEAVQSYPSICARVRWWISNINSTVDQYERQPTSLPDVRITNQS